MSGMSGRPRDAPGAPPTRKFLHPLSLRPQRLAACLAALSLGLALAGSPSAHAATPATETIQSGSLQFLSTPSNVAFPAAALNGFDLTRSQSQTLDVSDATGSNLGWAITATSTSFTNGAQSLPTDATSILTAPPRACDAGSTCSLATNTVSYPYTLPAGPSAPTASKVFNASAGSGMGNQTITPTWTLDIPASARTGNYTSTWTFTLTAGP